MPRPSSRISVPSKPVAMLAVCCVLAPVSGSVAGTVGIGVGFGGAIVGVGGTIVGAAVVVGVSVAATWRLKAKCWTTVWPAASSIVTGP